MVVVLIKVQPSLVKHLIVRPSSNVSGSGSTVQGAGQTDQLNFSQ